MLDRQKFSERIQERRRVVELTQEQLGEKLKVSGQAVSKWENGDSMPDIDLVPKLADVLGVSTDYLLGHTPEIDVEVGHPELAVGKVKVRFDYPFVTRGDGSERKRTRRLGLWCVTCGEAKADIIVEGLSVCYRCVGKAVVAYNNKQPTDDR